MSYEQWLAKKMGSQWRGWEAAVVAQAIENAFGYYALQVGSDHLPLLSANRMPHRLVAKSCGGLAGELTTTLGSDSLATLVLDPQQLPFQSNQLDLLLYSHSLEQAYNPRQAIREAERVLLPEGKLVISGINPWHPSVGWAAARQALARYRRKPPPADLPQFNPISVPRLRDWLALLGFEVEVVVLGGSRSGGAHLPELFLAAPAPANGKVFTRQGSLFARAFVIVATKKVPGMRLLGSPWQVKSPYRSLAGQPARRVGTRSEPSSKLSEEGP